MLAENPRRDVGRPARRVRHHDLDRLRWILVLRDGRAAERQGHAPAATPTSLASLSFSHSASNQFSPRHDHCFSIPAALASFSVSSTSALKYFSNSGCDIGSGSMPIFASAPSRRDRRSSSAFPDRAGRQWPAASWPERTRRSRTHRRRAGNPISATGRHIGKLRHALVGATPPAAPRCCRLDVVDRRRDRQEVIVDAARHHLGQRLDRALERECAAP